MQKLLRYLCFAAVIISMVCAAEKLGEKEIIFPEAAALAVGCFLTPSLAWRTSYVRLVICIELCALIGMAIVMMHAFSLWVELALAFCAAQLVRMYSGTTLAPMISAAVLPVMMQSEGLVYPAAALVICVFIVCLRLLLEGSGIAEKNAYKKNPPPEKDDWRLFFFTAIVVFVFAFLSVRLNAKFCIAPPLLVAFTELCKKDFPAKNRRVDIALLVALCALAGALSRLFIVEMLSLSPVYAAVLISAFIIILMRLFKLWFPPAGAIAVLALIVPQSALVLYSLHIFIGISLLSLAAAAYSSLNFKKAQNSEVS